jgi:hypothetical protein
MKELEALLLERLEEVEKHEEELRSKDSSQDILDYSFGKRHGLSEALNILRKLKEGKDNE